MVLRQRLGRRSEFVLIVATFHVRVHCFLNKGDMMNKFLNFRRDAIFCVSTALILLMLCCFHAPAFADLNTGLVADGRIL